MPLTFFYTVMETYPIYCGGKFKTTATSLVIINPYSGEQIAETYLAGKSELEEAIVAAQSVKKEMAEMTSSMKQEIFLAIIHGLKENREKLGLLIAKEAGKPLKYALGEVDRAIQTFVIAMEECKRIPAEYIHLDWTTAGHGKEGIVKYFPIGLIAGIAPFNFPLNLAVHKIAPAIASGNPIILKPARSTPIATLELSKILDSTSLPKGAVSILPMDRQTGNQLVTDSRFNMLSFTGSPDVGWKMKNEAGKKKVVLELGGNAGVIVTETANLNTAVGKCIAGAFAYQGQVCIHVQRIYVDDTIFDRFKDRFVEGTKNLKAGAPELQETDITSMIDEENAKRVEEWVAESVADGAEVIWGGKRKSSYFEPTILTNVKKKCRVCCEEVFGPVVILERYKVFEEAVAQINDSRFGLQAGVFTNQIDQMNYAFKNLEVGGVIINDVPTFRVDHMPYGGIKDSGFGREGVKYAIAEMMEPKLLVKDS